MSCSLRRLIIIASLVLFGSWAASCVDRPAHKPIQGTGGVTTLTGWGRWAETLAHVTGAWVTGRNLSCGSMHDPVLYAYMIRDMIDDFKDTYSLQVFGVQWETVDKILDPRLDNRSVEICDEKGQQCFSVVPTLPPPPHRPPASGEQAKHLLLMVLGYTQRYGVAFDTLFLDQSLYENQFLEEMAKLHAMLEDLMDSIMTTVHKCGLTPDQRLIRDLSQRLYKGVDAILREERGFRVLRQTCLGMQYIIDVFSNSSSSRS
ncbi:uncharacterized protein [Panulirus ornatus]|uniref:uncharacterized protein n=1 Tax=Panulirus ornatus TaxID=150431 RepID=UPI003A84FD4D